ncbi:MAG: sugar ABC transporter ATP-binding protein [Lachnospiraceae bacterium]|nr:sugar ABC transporter ATP-binding protein [Lachnospiraceae bacterium]
MGCLVQMRGITKKFPGVVALDHIDLDLQSGEVHLLLGENGAGKSTLMKILSGVYEPTEGSILMEGKEYRSLTPQLSRELKIAVIYQELSVIDELSIAENLFIGRIPTRKAGILKTVDRKAMFDKAREILDRIGFEKNVRTPVSSLSISEKQQVEIAKALAADARIIIMDEPTSSLTEEESGRLFQVIRQLTSDGAGVFYISHKLQELKKIGNRVTVLKDGKRVDTLEMGQVKSEGQLISMMVGRDIGNKRLREGKTLDTGAENILEIRNLTRKDGKIKNVSFDLKRGEILGFAGLVGSGRTELMNAVFGAEPVSSGEILFEGKAVKNRNTYQALKNGFALITENRRETGFFDNFEIYKNISSVNLLKKTGMGGVTGFVNRKKEIGEAEKQKELLSVKCTSVHQMIRDLSGGNQQKVIIGKWLNADAKLMIFDEPTRGIDVGAKSEIYQILKELSEKGKGIIVVSSELPELLILCDRVVVFGHGEIRGVLDAEEMTEEAIMELAAL